MSFGISNGPIPRTSRGKTGILVITDLFSRWVEAFPIPEVTTERVMTILRSCGYLQCLLTDSGCQSISHQRQQALAT